MSIPDTPSEDDDGLLTASEIGQLRFRSRWVVLAACQTATAEKLGAEALSGLARAFIHAGARAILVSHWRVGPEVAARLTSTVLALTSASPPVAPTEALRRAMLTFAADTKDPWNAYPSLWAPFILVGEGAR